MFWLQRLRLLALVPFCLLLSSCSNSTSNAGQTQTPTPDFTLAAGPSSAGLVAGGAGQTVTLTASPVNSFTGTVGVTIAGLPAGVTAQPATVSLTAGSPATVTLTAGSAAALGPSVVSFTGVSGSLSHTATVNITVTAPPDFTFIVAPSTQALSAGGVGAQFALRADGVNGFSGSVTVTVAGLPAGVTVSPSSLNLTPGTAGSVTLTASPGAMASTSTLTFTATAGGLTHTATATLVVQSALTSAAPDVPTYHYDATRNGLNAQETILTPANVKSTLFGRVGFDATDGHVDAQPLFLANVVIGGSAHNVLYVATEHGSVYAFDADTGQQLWKTSLIPAGETTSDDRGCGQVDPEIGITSTPVIDRAAGKIFSVTMSKQANGTYHQRLHALDIVTGAEVSGSPSEITASYPGTGSGSKNGTVVFDPGQYVERASLLLLNGKIYTAWGSHCDLDPYTGWVMAFNETTLQQTSVINLTPNGARGSIWMSGSGLGADSAGNIYLADANGTFTPTLNSNGFPSNGNYGNALVRLTDNGTLSVADYFATYDTVALSNADLDLGSGGIILLPDMKDAGGNVRHLIVAAGKSQRLIVADRDNLGHFNPSTTSPDSNVYQEVTGSSIGLEFGNYSFFNGTLYMGAINQTLAAYPFTNARMSATPSSQSVYVFGFPGTTPVVSANGTTNGIVWTLLSSAGYAAELHALDPANLANEFYNSNMAANGRDSFGTGNKYITPVVVNGKVYVGTTSGVVVFGLLPH